MNYEALDAFGVNVSAASLENSEYVKSLGKSWNQLSDNEKMMAVYNEVVRQGASAKGLAAQEADQFGMKMKLLKQKIMETVASIGEKLLPVLEPLIEKFMKTVEKIADWVKENPELTRTILAVVGAIGVFMLIVGPIVSLIGSIAMAMAGLTLASMPVILTVLAVVAVIGILVAAGIWLIANWGEIKQAASDMCDRIGEAWNNLKQWAVDTYNGIVESISTAWENMKTSFSNAWNSCVETVSAAWEWIKLAVQAGLQFVGDLIGLAFDIITLPWQFIWQNCGDYVIQAWEWIKTTIGDGLNFVGDKVKEGWDKVMSVTQPAWDAITGYISGKWDQLKGWASEKFNAIKDAVSQAWEITKSASSEAWGIITGALSDKWNEIKDKASEKFNTVKTTVSNAWNSIKDTTSTVWGNVKDSVSKTWDNIKDTVKRGVDKLKSLVNFKWDLPKLKMPHITTSGKFSINPPSVPHFGIEWKSAGGIFRRPTVLGSGYGVGDKHRGAGSNAEAVLPLNKLPELLGLDKNEGKQLVVNIEEFNNNTEQDIESLCNEIAFQLKRRRVV
ncbi:phage tail tape measure protein [Paraclostridium dentum]|uniref:phage tail tape measure protein n=1 Tax=Paraclostridium dentum TaxID=2662455 RepID=UPI0014727C3B|nr:phage tail tape measure protein [Paraclostridium dentum]